MGCLVSIVVPASVEAVWAKLSNFHDMGWAAGVIDSCEPIGDMPGTEKGAGRILNGIFTETLLGIEQGKRALRYSIDRAPGTPVDGVDRYIGVVRAFPVTKTGETFVVWSSSWGKGSGGAEIGEFCTPIYSALLDALVASFE